MNSRPKDFFDPIITALAGSRFRSSFRLRQKELDYLAQKGLETVRRHAEDFIRSRLAPANPKNDGKQTPTKGHPVFIAQHATATCCRKCLEKWHKTPMGVELDDKQVDYIVDLIMAWMTKHVYTGS